MYLLVFKVRRRRFVVLSARDPRQVLARAAHSSQCYHHRAAACLRFACRPGSGDLREMGCDGWRIEGVGAFFGEPHLRGSLGAAGRPTERLSVAGAAGVDSNVGRGEAAAWRAVAAWPGRRGPGMGEHGELRLGTC